MQACPAAGLFLGIILKATRGFSLALRCVQYAWVLLACGQVTHFWGGMGFLYSRIQSEIYLYDLIRSTAASQVSSHGFPDFPPNRAARVIVRVC